MYFGIVFSKKKKNNTMDKISESRNTELTMELYDNLRVKNAFKSVYYIRVYHSKISCFKK